MIERFGRSRALMIAALVGALVCAQTARDSRLGSGRLKWLPMKSLVVSKTSVLTMLAAWAAGWGIAQAGDPIILPSDQVKPQPAPDALTTKELLKPTERLPKVNPQHIEGLSLPTPPGRRKKTEQEKRQQAARDERRNWLLLRPGELTDSLSEDRSFGVRLDKWATADEDTDRRDYTFYGLDRTKHNGQREPKLGQTRQPDAQTQASAKRAEELDDKDKRKATSGNALLLYDEASPARGAHLAKELDLRGYLDTTIVDLQSSSQGQTGLEGLLPASGALSRSKQQQARLDQFKEFLNAPKGPAVAGEGAPPGKLSPDLGRPPASQTRSLPESSLSLGAAGSLSAPAELGGAGLPRGLSMPGVLDLNLNRFSTPSRLPTAPPAREPMAGQPVSRPSVLRPTVLEIPSTR